MKLQIPIPPSPLRLCHCFEPPTKNPARLSTEDAFRFVMYPTDGTGLPRYTGHTGLLFIPSVRTLKRPVASQGVLFLRERNRQRPGLAVTKQRYRPDRPLHLSDLLQARE